MQYNFFLLHIQRISQNFENFKHSVIAQDVGTYLYHLLYEKPNFIKIEYDW